MGAHASTRRTGTATAAPTRQPAAPCAVYIDPEAHALYLLAPGVNVILCDDILGYAQLRGLGHVATLAQFVIEEGMQCVRLVLYADDVPSREGGVGRACAEIIVPARSDGIMRPLPFYLRNIESVEIERRTEAFRVWADALASAPKGPDPDRRLQAACACSAADTKPGGGARSNGSLARDNVLALITDPTPEGHTRRTTLVHDGATADPARCMRPVIVTTTGLPGGISRYGIASASPERIVQSAALCAYGLPLTPAYYGAVEWARWPDYARLVEDVRRRRQQADGSGAQPRVVDVDNVWLYRLVSDLVDRGYRATSADLGLPDGA